MGAVASCRFQSSTVLQLWLLQIIALIMHSETTTLETYFNLMPPYSPYSEIPFLSDRISWGHAEA
jgi:hypothetical protein